MNDEQREEFARNGFVVIPSRSSQQATPALLGASNAFDDVQLGSADSRAIVTGDRSIHR